MKKLISRVLTLTIVAGMISSTTSYGIRPGGMYQQQQPMSKAKKAKMKTENKKEQIVADKLNKANDHLANVAGNPDATEDQINDAAEKVASAKEEAEGFFEKYVGEWTPTKMALAGAITTAVTLGVAVGVEKVIGTSYIADTWADAVAKASSAASYVSEKVSPYVPEMVKTGYERTKGLASRAYNLVPSWRTQTPVVAE